VGLNSIQGSEVGPLLQAAREIITAAYYTEEETDGIIWLLLLLLLMKVLRSYVILYMILIE
jgi:hypothetical protein